MLKGKVILEVPSLAIMCTRHCRYLKVYISVKVPTLYHCANALCTQPMNIETLCNSLTKVVVNDKPSLTADILKHATSCMMHHFYLAIAFNNLVSLNINF